MDSRTRKIRELEAERAHLQHELLAALSYATRHPEHCVCGLCSKAHQHGVVYREALDRRAPVQTRMRLA